MYCRLAFSIVVLNGIKREAQHMFQSNIQNHSGLVHKAINLLQATAVGLVTCKSRNL